MINEIRSSINNKKKINNLYQPDHTIESHFFYIPLNPNYVSGFLEGDGSLMVELSGSRMGRISLSIDQNENNRLLLESLKSIFKIDSKLVFNKNTKVLKFQHSGDKYFKEILMPFVIKYPLYGYKSVQLLKILNILELKQSKSNYTKDNLQLLLIKIWKNDELGYTEINHLKKKFLSLARGRRPLASPLPGRRSNQNCS